jgi:aspartyl aminopeptidase
MKTGERDYTKDLLSFLDNAPTAAHAVRELINIVRQKGYREIRDEDPWQITPGEGFYLVREETGFIAGIMSRDPSDEAPWNIAAAHTDSPGFRIKPNPVIHKQGAILLGAEVYGGPLLASWTDRDLSLAGRLIIREKENELSTRLWTCKKPVLRIPQVAVHLNRKVNEEGLTFNTQTQMVPIYSINDNEPAFSHKDFIHWVARENKVDPESIVDMQLELYDTQAASHGGPDDQFLLSGRIDNLAMCFSAVHALPPSGTMLKNNALVMCFDNEETGSKTLRGGDSFFTGSVLERLSLSSGTDRETFLRILTKSVLFSADGVHAVHPNYPELHEPSHLVYMNRGPALKINAQNRYATSLHTSALFKELARKTNVPVQTYLHRSDIPCGSTIGPLVSAQLGLKTLDAGIGMLSMHSVREMAGISDIHNMTKMLMYFLNPEE